MKHSHKTRKNAAYYRAMQELDAMASERFAAFMCAKDEGSQRSSAAIISSQNTLSGSQVNLSEPSNLSI